jgi:glycosyltransferase involved in cell wall biosynthesis
MANKKRLLIVQSRVSQQGGGNLVTAWTLQALCGVYDVSLAALWPVNHSALNRSFGTTLNEGDFKIHIAPPKFHRMLRWTPTRGAQIERSLVARFAQDLDRTQHYDLLFSTHNEIDFHRRGLQYVHYPAAYLPRPENEMRWFHKVPGVLPAYLAFCRRVQRATRAGWGRNQTMVNSKFVAERFREVYGTDPVVVYPPVPGDFPEVPWASREAGFVAAGRLHETKRWEVAVSIIDEVRRRGHPVTLTIIGQPDGDDYLARLQELARTRPWFRMLYNLSREQLVHEMTQRRYGIHTMEEEHFGIAPAEIQRAGCITFVHNSGGPAEIVGGHPQLVFNTVEEAGGKIERVLTDGPLEQELRSHVALQRDRFTVDTFCQSIREIVAGLESEAA